MELFITATDTDAGKTFVTALLALAAAEAGRSTAVVKLVATGCKGGESDDISFVRDGLSSFLDAKAMSRCSFETLECFSFAASPHLAAAKEGRRVDPDRLLSRVRGLKGRYDIVLIEGVGGLMVPLNQELLLIDLIEGLEIECLLVSKSWLGTINHTLLSLDAMKRRDIPVRAVMLNSGGGTSKVPDSYLHPDIISDNRQIIERFGSVEVLGPVPNQPNLKEALSQIEGQVHGLLGL